MNGKHHLQLWLAPHHKQRMLPHCASHTYLGLQAPSSTQKMPEELVRFSKTSEKDKLPPHISRMTGTAPGHGRAAPHHLPSALL